MNFASGAYGYFLIAVFAAFWLLRSHRTARLVLLLGASWYFYACWNAYYLLLIIGSSALDYWVGARIAALPKARSRERLWLLRISLLGNLGCLGTFKYYDFFRENIEAALASFDVTLPHLDVLLPVGISFYTFQTLSYTIDIYRGQMEPARNLREFALFVAFFPQLVAGPIVRAREFLPQLERKPELTGEDVRFGLWRIGWGLFKKVLIADVIAVGFADKVFADGSTLTGGAALLGIYAYTIQVYCDFSGYSDIAIGSARLFGIRIPENFDRPYLCKNIRDFWRRWHITLGSWLRDYLYIPLGGSRRGSVRTYFNLIATMVLGGLWHGAGWSFVVWGMHQGVWLACSHFWKVHGLWRPQRRLTTLLTILWTYHGIAFAWCFIRADIDLAFDVMARATRDWSDWSPWVEGGVMPWYVWLALLAGLATHLLPRAVERRAYGAWLHMPAFLIGAVWALFVGLLALVMSDAIPFVYFQF